VFYKQGITSTIKASSSYCSSKKTIRNGAIFLLGWIWHINYHKCIISMKNYFFIENLEELHY